MSLIDRQNETFGEPVGLALCSDPYFYSIMVKIPFSKYHGAGNDFILIDDRNLQWSPQIDHGWVANVCHRHFGIGADGLIILQPGTGGAVFYMKYYNADGNESTFCGNGARCAVAFAAELGIHDGTCRFAAKDGSHEATIHPGGLIHLGMIDVNKIEPVDIESYVLFTGSPHYVSFVADTEAINVKEEGRTIRNSPRFLKEGINVNFVQILGPSEIRIRTYERGVEDETMACGTGVVAAAIAHTYRQNDTSGQCFVQAVGGSLKVEFNREAMDTFSDVRLIGPAVEVFKGEIALS